MIRENTVCFRELGAGNGSLAYWKEKTMQYKKEINNVQRPEDGKLFMSVYDFEAHCGFSYSHQSGCNGGHNCRHFKADAEAVGGEEIGYCYAFSCPYAEKYHDDDDFVDVHLQWAEERDKDLEFLWRELEDVSVDPVTERIEEAWHGWEAGTHREEIWRWFDEIYSKGVAALMYER